MTKRKNHPLLVFLSYILILVGSVSAYHNSFDIALRKEGLSKKYINYIDTGIDDNGNEYRVVFQYDGNDSVRILSLTKNRFGIWNVTNEISSHDSEAQHCAMGWMRAASIRRFAVEEQSNIEFEVHAVYSGNDAIKRIELPTDCLPPNVTANVFQAGAMYVIHFSSYGAADTLNQIDTFDLLEQIKCIQRS